uniref:Uncharacterized protein n=1 Tax=Anguilla anguilla TaxID=7936 RepID=A0A0E9WED4_ANGAN
MSLQNCVLSGLIYAQGICSACVLLIYLYFINTPSLPG